jgi:hypothetical protein
MYVEAISDEKNRSLIEYTKALVCRFFSNPYVNHQRHVCHKKTNGNSLSAKQTTKHNLLPKKNTTTMIPPARRPPADPIFKVSDIAVHRAIEHHLRYTAMQFFYVQLTLSLFY